MLFGKREGRATAPRSRRRVTGFRPRADQLEARQLLASIDMVNIADAPYGVQMLGQESVGGAGFSVANLGDVNGDGFDDFLIGAPTLSRESADFPVLGLANNSQTFLVFGSSTATEGAITDFLQLDPNDRIGDLGNLGNLNQANPITGVAAFPFNGLTFQLPGVPGAQLGASVAAVGDINGDGYADFLIGAPGAGSPTNPLNVGAGRAFLVYGGPQLATRANKIVDLANPSDDINVITFFTNLPNSNAGRSVAGIGDFLPDGIPDIAIGAPGATLNGLDRSGAVFVVPGNVLRPARTQSIDLLSIGQPRGTPGVVFTGERAGQGAGFSVAGAGDVDGANPGLPDSTDLLIGAPDTVSGLPGTTNGPGRAYLIYGNRDLPNVSVDVNGFNSITLNRVNVPTAEGDIPGAVFVGTQNGDLTGYSVSTAGDFNGDNLADFLIGSPGFNGLAGRADMFYGLPASQEVPGPILGRFELGDLPPGLGFASFFGASPGDLAGLAVGATGRVNNDPLNEILIGAPGTNDASGVAYLIPGNAGLFGPVSLDQAAIQGAPAFGTLITDTEPAFGNLFGASVSGLPFSRRGRTMDSDNLADFVIGAPNYSISGRSQAGSAFLLEGAFVPLQTPVSQAVTSPIGVDGVRPPFVINATTPADLPIFILSAGANPAGFQPTQDIDPRTILVNGVPLPNPESFTNVGDLDGDGIDDAGFIFTPRAELGLRQGNQQIIVQARTAEGSPLANRIYQGSANVVVRVTPSNGGGVGPTLPLAPFGGNFQNLNAAAPRFGERLLPAPNVIGWPRWAPLPKRIAYRQFVPQGAFGLRLRNFFHPVPGHQKAKSSMTLDRSVFLGGRFPKGVHFGRIDHKGPVVGTGNI